MKLLLDINDNKSAFILELLESFKYIKINNLSPYKAEVLEDVKEAVTEMNLIKEGKLKGIPAKDLLNEL